MPRKEKYMFMSPSEFNRDRDKRILKCIQDGMLTMAIAERFGVPERWVIKIANRNGIRLRSRAKDLAFGTP